MTPAGFHPAPREDGVALWRQIANALEAEIAAATLDPGARLPTG